jgi:hypothetical protein
VFLEQLLKSAGWSYKIVTDEEAFEDELRSGAYSQYALFAEHEHLDEHAQKELREAVFRGEGLLDASRGDRRRRGLNEALGITRSGEPGDEDENEWYHWRAEDWRDSGFNTLFGGTAGGSNSGGWPTHHEPPRSISLELFDAALGPVGSASIAFPEDIERVTLSGARAIGRFQGMPIPYNTAVTTYTYGQGRSVHVGYDLLAEATRAGSASLHASLLKSALEYVKANLDQPRVGQVVPLHLVLTNKGLATPGRVVLPMPAGAAIVDAGTAQASNGTLTWTFDLAKDQRLELDAWVRLPATVGTASFDALVQTGTGSSYVDHTHAKLDLQTNARATIADARALAGSSPTFVKVRYWLDNAQFWLDRNKPYAALASLLAATDELIKCRHAQSAPLRLMIDQAIWDVSRRL